MALSSSTGNTSSVVSATSCGQTQAATSGLGASGAGAFFLKRRTFPIFSPLKVDGSAGTGRPVFFDGVSMIPKRSLGYAG
jgi:hypothetical protein